MVNGVYKPTNITGGSRTPGEKRGKKIPMAGAIDDYGTLFACDIPTKSNGFLGGVTNMNGRWDQKTWSDHPKLIRGRIYRRPISQRNCSGGNHLPDHRWKYRFSSGLKFITTGWLKSL